MSDNHNHNTINQSLSNVQPLPSSYTQPQFIQQQLVGNGIDRQSNNINQNSNNTNTNIIVPKINYNNDKNNIDDKQLNYYQYQYQTGYKNQQGQPQTIEHKIIKISDNKRINTINNINTINTNTNTNINTNANANNSNNNNNIPPLILVNNNINNINSINNSNSIYPSITTINQTLLNTNPHPNIPSTNILPVSTSTIPIVPHPSSSASAQQQIPQRITRCPDCNSLLRLEYSCTKFTCMWSIFLIIGLTCWVPCVVDACKRSESRCITCDRVVQVYDPTCC